MERLTGIEIRVCEEATELGSPYERELVGEQAKEWLRDHYALGDDPRVEQDRAREMTLVLMAARTNQIEEACRAPLCAGCVAFEAGYKWLAETLPEAYQHALRQHGFIERMRVAAANAGRN